MQRGFCHGLLGSAAAGDDDAVALVARAGAVAGDGLAAVILHGSWVRGDATPASDVDALVVVDPRIAVTRGLYRTWDTQRVHYVADVLEAERRRLPVALAGDLERLAAASRGLRRDRELAFDGAEDLTPSEFYREQDAAAARNTARLVVERVRPHVLGD